MRIADLLEPVVAAKSDWLVASHWIGFTPVGTGPDATSRCTSTIARQAAGGYVVEYITQSFGEPNPGSEHDARFLSDREEHRKFAGKLVGVHKLRPTARPLRQIVGEEEYEWLQNTWARDGHRNRWSVAFPIIESYAIADDRQASRIFGAEAMKRLFAHPSATLRPMNDEERGAIADLMIERRPSASSWIAIEDEFEAAERSEIPKRLVRDIGVDLALAAFEGMDQEKFRRIRQRAVWIANRFAMRRWTQKTFRCDDCGFDPIERVDGTGVKPRSLLDVHHKHPLEEGVRYTTELDFALLCPNCHRFAHRLLEAERRTA